MRVVRGNFYRSFGKRGFDLILCAFLMIPIAVIGFLVAVLIQVFEGSPVLYRGLRTGRFDSRFRILKFRTMIPDAERNGGPTTGLNDVRVTGMGRFLRRFKLDELPQFINVLTGEMSFVGPRPEVPQYTQRFDDREKLILTVRPGITDLSSIRFHELDRIVGQSNVDEIFETKVLPRKNRLRIFYVEHLSFCLDLRILITTAAKLFGRFK